MPITEIEHKGPPLKGAKNHNDKRLPGVAEPLPDGCCQFQLYCGLPGSGKSSLVLSLLESPQAYARKYDNIYFFSQSMHTLPAGFLEKLHPDRTFTDFSRLDEIIEMQKQSEDNSLFVFDDMVKAIDKMTLKTLVNMAYNRRHLGGGISIIFITQKITAVPLQLRVSVSSVFFWSWRSKRELDSCFSDYASAFLDEKEWNEVVRYAQKKAIPHSFLFLNMEVGKVYLNWNELSLE